MILKPLKPFGHVILWVYIGIIFDPYFLSQSVQLSYLPTPPLGQDMTQGQFFKRRLAGLNSEFSFS